MMCEQSTELEPQGGTFRRESRGHTPVEVVVVVCRKWELHGPLSDAALSLVWLGWRGANAKRFVGGEPNVTVWSVSTCTFVQ